MKYRIEFKGIVRMFLSQKKIWNTTINSYKKLTINWKERSNLH